LKFVARIGECIGMISGSGVQIIENILVGLPIARRDELELEREEARQESIVRTRRHVRIALDVVDVMDGMRKERAAA
jgi:hypothetical protein